MKNKQAQNSYAHTEDPVGANWNKKENKNPGWTRPQVINQIDAYPLSWKGLWHYFLALLLKRKPLLNAKEITYSLYVKTPCEHKACLPQIVFNQK